MLGALRNGAPLIDLPDAFKRLQQHLLKNPGGDREMVEILALVQRTHRTAIARLRGSRRRRRSPDGLVIDTTGADHL
jgi:hypothetical protein